MEERKHGTLNRTMDLKSGKLNSGSVFTPVWLSYQISLDPFS